MVKYAVDVFGRDVIEVIQSSPPSTAGDAHWICPVAHYINSSHSIKLVYGRVFYCNVTNPPFVIGRCLVERQSEIM